ncbi:hypothetical protein FKP32DRAFT_1761426 [Trametes sanguinea]|nr:hypothetical protein FKP32DRAFT_1761426 [Trametes sanguinea]
MSVERARPDGDEDADADEHDDDKEDDDEVEDEVECTEGEDEDDEHWPQPRPEETETLRFVWVRDGTVDYDALPPRSSIRVPDRTAATAAAAAADSWTVVGRFSVDSGTACLFSKHALDAVLASGAAAGADREEMLEAFLDDDFAGNVFVPGGIVVSGGNDGEYDVWGRRDGEGRLVELKVQEAYGSE